MLALTDHLQGHSRDMSHLSPTPCPHPGGRQKVPRVSQGRTRGHRRATSSFLGGSWGVCRVPAGSSGVRLGDWKGLEQ